MEKQLTIILLAILITLLCANQSKQCVESFEDLTDKISNVFEPNVHSIKVEAFGDSPGPQQPSQEMMSNGQRRVPLSSYGPPVGGTQLTSYQLYQQAVNAATPTVNQLQKISNLPGGGQGFINTPDAPGIVPPSGDPFYNAAAVNFGNRRAELISPCAQNAPTFVASSLLPKMNIPGVPSWQVTDTTALANQDFLSPTQQIGVDTVLSSNRNPSYDIRNEIPNPINVVSPWLNTTITPDLQRRPLDTYVPASGVYGAGINNTTYGPGAGPLASSV